MSEQPRSDVIQLEQIAQFLAELPKAAKWKSMPIQAQRLLLALYTQGEVDQSDMEKHTGVSNASISRHITRLGEGSVRDEIDGLGWVETYENQLDRRGNVVRLTPLGRATVGSIYTKITGKITGKK